MSWWNPLTWLGEEKTDPKTGEPVVVPLGTGLLVGGDAELRAGMAKLRAYADGVITAIDALNEPPPEDQPEQRADLDGWKKSVRNRILAGDGEKARFFGTISTAPVVTAQELEGLGIDKATAANLTAERDKLRSAALDMAPVGK